MRIHPSPSSRKISSIARTEPEVLESLTEEDLDKPTKAPPKGREREFATYGQSFLVLALHQTMHRGNVTDARRAAGRAALVDRHLNSAAPEPLTSLGRDLSSCAPNPVCQS